MLPEKEGAEKPRFEKHRPLDLKTKSHARTQRRKGKRVKSDGMKEIAKPSRRGVAFRVVSFSGGRRRKRFAQLPRLARRDARERVFNGLSVRVADRSCRTANYGFARSPRFSIGIGFNSDKSFWNRRSSRSGSQSGDLASSPNLSALGTSFSESSCVIANVFSPAHR